MSVPAPTAINARFALRAATQDQHYATEKAIARFDLTDREGYRDFLRAHAVALGALEPGVDQGGWPRWRSRFALLQADLAALDAPVATPSPAVQTPIVETDCWGVQYVLEGSRLGGRILASRIGAGLPASYLTPNADAGQEWRAFCDALDVRARDQGARWLTNVSEAATDAFRTFRQSAELLET